MLRDSERQASSVIHKTHKTLYGISRVDDEVNRSHGWRVSLRRHGRRFVKSFPDKKYRGRSKALAQARQYRNLIVSLYPPLTRAEFSNTLRKNNTSGVPGVSFVTYRYQLPNGREREASYWEAIWPTSPGSSARRRFSTAIYSYQRAFELACAARQRELENVEGFYWCSQPAMSLLRSVRPKQNVSGPV